MLVRCISDEFIIHHLCPECGHYMDCPIDYRCPAAVLLSNLYSESEEEDE